MNAGSAVLHGQWQASPCGDGQRLQPSASMTVRAISPSGRAGSGGPVWTPLPPRCPGPSAADKGVCSLSLDRQESSSPAGGGSRGSTHSTDILNFLKEPTDPVLCAHEQRMSTVTDSGTLSAHGSQARRGAVQGLLFQTQTSKRNPTPTPTHTQAHFLWLSGSLCVSGSPSPSLSLSPHLSPSPHCLQEDSRLGLVYNHLNNNHSSTYSHPCPQTCLQGGYY